jgi:integrase
MLYDFKSRFAESLYKFIAQKRSLGIDYSSNLYYLRRFDEMCAVRFPIAKDLSKEICCAFAVRKDTENATSFRNRISPVREFAKFLIRNGETAFVLPADFAKKSPRCLPYIYSKDEIARIWYEFDNMPHIPYWPTRRIVLSAIIRVLYCCGLRPVEACRLLRDDVDLSIGRLFIRESKGHRDRIVMLPDDLTEYLRNYDKQMFAMLPSRKWFFTNTHNTICTTKWINAVFAKIRDKLNIYGANRQIARLYDIRHTFATHRLYDWMKDGEDVYTLLNNLSAYMGHAQITDIYYYIHFVPEQLQALAGVDFSRYESLMPEVTCCE